MGLVTIIKPLSCTFIAHYQNSTTFSSNPFNPVSKLHIPSHHLYRVTESTCKIILTTIRTYFRFSARRINCAVNNMINVFYSTTMPSTYFYIIFQCYQVMIYTSSLILSTRAQVADWSKATAYRSQCHSNVLDTLVFSIMSDHFDINERILTGGREAVLLNTITLLHYNPTTSGGHHS